MRKMLIVLAAAVLIVVCFSSCTKNQSVKVEKRMENGVEVVVNHLQPYTVPGEPFVLNPKEELVIDTEDEAVAAVGLTDIGTLGSNSVEVDAEGNIYLLCSHNPEGQILKFASDGTFLTAFAPKGQGPGEFQSVSLFTVYPGPDGEDEISVAQQSTGKVAFFRTDGTLITEKKAESALKYVRRLKEDRYLIWTHVLDGSGKFLMKHPLLITDSDFQPVSELDIQNVPNPMSGERMKGFYYILSWAVSGDRIFTGFQDRDYEIRMYDQEGRLVRLIRKEYKRVPVPDEHKKAYMSQFESPMFDSIREKIYFPEAMPPFIGFISDKAGRLFVLTYEEGNNPGEKMVDVFDDGGVFVGRKSLRLTYDEFGVHAIIKNGRLYAVEEKESGFKRLVVSRIRLSLPPF